MEGNTNADVDKLITFGQMAIEQGWYDQARDYFEQALTLDASNRKAMKGLARVNEILSRKEAVELTKPEVPVAKPAQPAEPKPEQGKPQCAGDERGGKKRWLALAVVIPVLLLILYVAYQRVQVPQLALLNLGPDLIHPEELGLFGGQITHTGPDIWYSSVPDGDNHFSQELTNRGGEHRGWVSISLFESTDELNQAFDIAIVNQNLKSLADPEAREKYKWPTIEYVKSEAIVGEKAVAYTWFGGTLGFAFTKCHALVNVLVSGADIGVVTSYSKSIAKRLAPLACR